MPMFDYQCKKCGDTSEYIVKSSDAKGLLCKACGSRQLTRLPGAAAYVTRPGYKAPVHNYPKVKFSD
jgi:putative FmdB family regulatory protein